MKPKKTNAASRAGRGAEVDPDHRLTASGGAATDAGEKTSRTRGVGNGGAKGQGSGAGRGFEGGADSGGMGAGRSGAGKEKAEPVKAGAEHEFWRKEYKNRPYFENGAPYEQYGPAFQYGWESCQEHKGKAFKDVETQLKRNWDDKRGQSKLSWDKARNAVRDAWQRVEQRCATGKSCS